MKFYSMHIAGDYYLYRNSYFTSFTFLSSNIAFNFV